MSKIDSMHHLFLGTSKKVIRVWLNEGVLDDKKFNTLQDRVDRIDTPTNIGWIPRKIATFFGGFTVNLWMHWTNVFPIWFDQCYPS